MFTESNFLARVRTDLNTLGLFLVYLNQETGEPYIFRFEKWVAVGDLKGFEGFEKVKVKTRDLYDTSTGERVAV
jgi:hypothetical protein